VDLCIWFTSRDLNIYEVKRLDYYLNDTIIRIVYIKHRIEINERPIRSSVSASLVILDFILRAL